jgi:DNA-binding response OmpR family regulator
VTGPPADQGSQAGAGPPADDRRVSVLLAEHEPEVAEMSARYLRRDGLDVRLVTSPELTLAELTAGPDAAAVIDLTMPGLDPRRIRRALRTPVIFLVAGSGGPRPRGLAVRGQRRWLARPFSPRQLATMVRDVLAQAKAQAEAQAEALAMAQPEAHAAAQPDAQAVAQAEAQAGAEAQARPVRTPLRPAVPGPVPTSVGRNAGGWRLDNPTRSAVAGGLRVPLTATEFAVLAALADHPGRVLSRRQLLAAAGRHGTGDRAADVLIAQLRAKLGPDAKTCAIRTIRGVGYVLDPLPKRPAAASPDGVEQAADQEADRGGPEADHDHLDALLTPVAHQRHRFVAAHAEQDQRAQHDREDQRGRAPCYLLRSAASHRRTTARTLARNRFQGGSSRGSEAAGLRSVAQQCRYEGDERTA